MTPKQLDACEKKLIKEFGFSNTQIAKIVKHKPTFLLFEEDYEKDKSGVRALFKFLVEENGVSEK